MESFHWKLFRYQLPLKESLCLLGHELFKRNGLVLRLYLGSSNISYNQKFGEGEIVTLPGMHQEFLFQAETQIKDYLSSRNNFKSQSYENLFTSVRFGLDMALRTLFNNLKEFSGNFNVNEIFESNYFLMDRGINYKKIPVNGLAIGSGTRLEQECKHFLAERFQAIKIKVGRLKVKEDIERVKIARKILGDEIQISLDANRAWKWEEAVEFSYLVKEFNIVYCEEPLRDFKKIEKLHEKTEIPIALDETLWKNPDPKTLPKKGIIAFILKPAILGGWEKTKFWVNYSDRNGIKSVLSSSFESGLGLNWIAFIAANLVKNQFQTGLDTAKWFRNDLIDPPFVIRNGFYIFPDSWPIANFNQLQLVGEGTWLK